MMTRTRYLSRTLRPNFLVMQTVRTLHNRQIDYYDVLGVDKYAELKEIKLAYFKMARKFHPDTNKTVDAKQMFELVAEAYDVLSDEKKKRDYDETGSNSERYGGRSQGPGRQSSDSTYTPEQMYSTIFSTGEWKGETEEMARQDFHVNYAGTDVSREYIANITFEESITGTNVLLNVRVAGTCNKCMGSRSELGYTGNVCPYCEGTGEETIKTGHIVGRKECSYCLGEKIFYKFKCIECEGLGRILYVRPYYVYIPPGTEHGQVMRVEIDNKVLDIPDEDVERERVLYVTASVKDSPFFTREGLDLLSYIRLSPAISILGGTVQYEGLTRSCDLSINVGTSSHTTLVVNQAGVHSYGCSGDHVLQTMIKVPKKLTWRQRRRFLKFAQLESSEYGSIHGVENELDHKYNVNPLTPDKIVNSVIRKAILNKEVLTPWQILVQKYDACIALLQKYNFI